MKMNKGIPALPNGLVVVDKGGFARHVMVGVLGGNRMPAFGFDVKGYPPNHFRMVGHGNFGVVIGARQALEVRILLDGRELLQTTLRPYELPNAAGMDPMLRQKMVESPQPHYLTQDAEGKAFKFEAYTGDLSLEDYIREQLHPGTMQSPPALSSLDKGEGEPVEEVKVDIDLAKYGFVPQAPVTDDDRPTQADAIEALTALASQSPDKVEGGEPSHDSDGGDNPVVAAVAASEPSSSAPDEVNPLTLSRSWAPSHGLLAVGVRMIQEESPEGVPSNPDGFTYVMFQLNPWDVHNKVMAQVMGRIIVPSKDAMKQFMIEEGFESELGGSTRCDVGCGLKHRHR
ncbi:MAG: hypothetical protein IPM23_02960 [Candidatus Melainabacteria bacterium]|nr:hypothetical protein [Candidatus Melainabacteria bacterium]